MFTRRTLLFSLILFGMTATIIRVEQLRLEARTRQVTAGLARLSAEGPGSFFKPDPRLNVAAFKREGVPIRTADGDGHTALMYAARIGDLELLEYALANGLDPNTPDVDGLTALTHAAISDRPDVIRLLVKHGADPTGAANPSLTPLMDACLHGHLASVSMLLKLGALTGKNYRSSLALVEDRERLHLRILRHEPDGSYMWKTAFQDAARSRTIRQMLEHHRPRSGIAALISKPAPHLNGRSSGIPSVTL